MNSIGGYPTEGNQQVIYIPFEEVTGDYDVYVKGSLVWSKKGGDGDCTK